LKNFRIILSSDRSEIQKVEKLLNEMNDELNLDMERFVNFQIAVSEALINAIVHGNKEDQNKKVYCEFEYSNKHFTIKIRDEGVGFDLNKIPDPTNSENILKEHGRGVFIIRSLVDEFECKASENGTEMILKVYK
jgi:serine/threonine-protein kinase RsbW